MKKLPQTLAAGWMAALLCTGCARQQPLQEISLKDALADKFLIGVAINSTQAAGRDTAATRIIRQHFNSIVAENCMKSEVIHPEENRYDFTLSDQFVEFGEANGMYIIGHTLIWHSQLAPWFCVDEKGEPVSPEVLTERMRDHIHTVVGRYKGRIKGWDVVNEAIEDDGSYRKSKFYEILGEEFIPLAFRFAQEADPDAELYYNDFSMAHPGKREGVVRLVKQLRERGIRIDAVGMQGHMQLDFPTVEAFEESMLAFAATGVKVMITELDMTVLPSPGPHIGANVEASFDYEKAMNPYPDGLPEEVSEVWNNRMNDFFQLFLKHSGIVSRVTLWGVADSDSWRNDWPMEGRTDYPLLFDRNHQPKSVVYQIYD